MWAPWTASTATPAVYCNASETVLNGWLFVAHCSSSPNCQVAEYNVEHWRTPRSFNIDKNDTYMHHFTSVAFYSFLESWYCIRVYPSINPVPYFVDFTIRVSLFEVLYNVTSAMVGIRHGTGSFGSLFPTGSPVWPGFSIFPCTIIQSDDYKKAPCQLHYRLQWNCWLVEVNSGIVKNDTYLFQTLLCTCWLSRGY